MQHFGTHSPDGSYPQARYHQGDLTYEIEFATRYESLIAHVRPLAHSDYLLVAELSFFFGQSGTIRKQDSQIVVSGKNATLYAASPNPEKPLPAGPADHRLVWGLRGDRWVVLTPEPPRISPEAIYRSQVEALREAYEKTRVESDGMLKDGAQAAADLDAWNIVWSHPAKGFDPPFAITDAKPHSRPAD